MSEVLVERLFRRESRRLVAALARRTRDLELAEEAVQEALVKALHLWPLRGVPDDPPAWLRTVAWNHALDRLRRDARQVRLEQESAAPDAATEQDDSLALLFACAHPALSREAHLPLMLNVSVGLGAAAIGRALLLGPAAVRKRISRAKAALRAAEDGLGLPPAAEWPERLGAVHEAIYAVFSLGHATPGDQLLDLGLCEEAIRLVELLCSVEGCDTPASHALAALCLLTAARIPARLSEAGVFVSLRDQDRDRWDRAALVAGLRHLDCARGDEVTRYHLEAGIAACHAAAPSFSATDWPQVLAFYDELVERFPSPMVRLNRALCLAEVAGPQAGLDTLAPLLAAPALEHEPHFFAARADLLARLGRRSAAVRELKRAIRAPSVSLPVRRAFELRLDTLQGE